MEQFTYLFGIYGIWSWALILGGLLLGLLFARATWHVGPRDVARMQKERFDLEQEAQKLRQEMDWAGQGGNAAAARTGSSDLQIDDSDFAPAKPKTGGSSGLIIDEPVAAAAPAVGGASGLIVESSAPAKIDHHQVMMEHFEDEHVRADPELGIIYEVEPEDIDPIGIIKGVGPRIERHLNELGVFRFKQIAHWTADNILNVTTRLQQFPIRIDRDKWVSQSRELWALVANRDIATYHAPDDIDHESKVYSDFAGEPVFADPSCGVLYEQAPEIADELHLINGIGPMMVDLLHQTGIYRYKQISNWSRPNVEHIAERLGTTPERITEERWIVQARRLHWETYNASFEWGNSKPTLSDYKRRIESEYAKEDVRADADLGVVYKTQPDNPDDLSQLPGLEDAFFTKLTELGVWRFRQVASWSEANVRAFARQLGLKPERIYQLGWIRKSWALAETARKKAAFAGESFRTDPHLGIVYYMEPMNSDHLTKIDGMTPRVAQILNEQGVYTFKQVALWDSENIRAAALIAGVDKNEIFRNRWVSQADDLHYKKYGTEL